jgi:N-acetylmuramoyl-L-alanine amidase
MPRTIARRLTLALAGRAVAFLLLACLTLPVAAQEKVRSARLWPSQDYTRLTLESERPLRYSLMLVKNPERVVLDLEGVDAASLQQALAGKLGLEDPYVAAARVGNFKPGTARLVLDLKGEVRPQIFGLMPVGEYGHRLVLDLYPIVPPDPLMALVQRQENGAATPEAGAETDREKVLPSAPAPREEAPAHRPKAAAPRTLTVVIDAGHGGEDPGARGPSGTLEKHVTLSIARRLARMIDAEPNMRAVLTRDGDFFIPLHMRVDKARRAKADLFVSVHADAFILPRARGSSVFALSERGATSAAARYLAKQENNADLIGGVNLNTKDRYLAQTLLDLSQTATINDSLKLGRAVLSELGGINVLHKENVEQAGFAVLKAPDIPSVLVETAFISNPVEERRLNDDAYQERMARAIADGIRRYFAKAPGSRDRLAQDEVREPAQRAPRRN